MPGPAIVMGDKITGLCPHLVIGPLGVPVPAPLPFSAPLIENLAMTVIINNRPAAVVGSSGLNLPVPHVGLHPTDPFMLPPLQRGIILTPGNPMVLFEGRPAASLMSTAKCCVVPGTIVPTVTNVIIG